MTHTEENRNANRLIITAIADDRPGLVDDIVRSIEQVGCSIETVSVASLDTAVSLTLLLRIPDGGTTLLRAALVGLTVEHNIKIHVDDMPDGSLHRPDSHEENQPR
ncbi:MAG: hypothetical protein F4X20_04995 [Dehalococcoidia bacterium]|nr:hypothetical protein [Dehalococcoidia bacterium]